MSINNFYNPSNPWMGNNGGTMNNTAGGSNPNGNYQSPGYFGFNNFQRPSVPSMLPGRQITNADEITPQEVPMDGSVSLFPKTDYSCIYAKMWNTDGTIRTVTFVPELPQDGQTQVNPVMQAFDNINERLDKIEKSLNKRNRPYKKHQNREVENNEQPNFQPAQQINQ